MFQTVYPGEYVDSTYEIDFEEFYNPQTNETILKMGENYLFVKPNYSNDYIQFKNQNLFYLKYLQDTLYR
mgnify:CR=1 FL=1